ncbi:signal peptidase I [Burkholderia ambifaria]|uniref:signal peptidase I n=1 Tax=Burkholderia ambifaria TaxID=152480 RepID=UPI000F80EF62|nr:signal peptidase I [Burkholderia ambifaria]
MLIFFFSAAATLAGTTLAMSATNSRKMVGYCLLVWGLGAALTHWFYLTDVLAGFVLLLVTLYLLDRLILSRRRLDHVSAPPLFSLVRSATPWLVALTLFRIFIVDYMYVPSSSMRPAMSAGDAWLVNMHAYGVHVPFLRHVFLRTGSVHRGDIVMFRFPGNDSEVFVKRAVGLPGDVVTYRDKRLSINGVPVPHERAGEFRYTDEHRGSLTVTLFREQLDGSNYLAAEIPGSPVYLPEGVQSFAGQEHCRYFDSGFSCKVPVGHYFMMGDNRDNSDDSRYWGFVSDAQLVGRAIRLLRSGDGLTSAERVGS